MPPIKHVFVLMLENRSFDHMLGSSGLTGTDAATGTPTKINGLTSAMSNTWNGTVYPARPPAVDPMKADPYHEFTDVLKQLCGQSAKYPSGGPYPPIDNSGFVSNFALDAIPNQASKGATPGDVMMSFDKSKLPVLTALAEEFAVCDSWFCSMPGPTWPNRFFALGASSADLDHSPTTPETIIWQTVDGFKFQNGSIFEAGKGFWIFKQKLKWRIYGGNKLFTLAHALKGIHIWDITRYSNFAGDVLDPGYDAQFTWIEPNYGHVTSDYEGGNSQHPLDGVTGGEALMKATYEAIRNSPLWESSMLIITWDEHGGFFDHVAPQPAPRPGDKSQFNGANKYGFPFDRYGPRVPAVIVSPLIPRNLIDHRVYDHTSILATVERLFKFDPLTARDAAALDVRSLASLPAPRSAPTSIALSPETESLHRQTRLDTLEVETPAATQEDEEIEKSRNLPGFLYIAGRTDAELPPPQGRTQTEHAARVRDRVGGIRTRRDARDYFEEVRKRTLESETRR